MTQMTIQQAFDWALRRHQAGQLGEAEAIYRQILAQDAGHAGALHMLGVIALQGGRFDVAAELIGEAVTRKPEYAEAQGNLGTALQGMGRLTEAMGCFRRAIALNPRYADAHYNLGNVLKAMGRLEEAAAAYRQTIAVKADYAEAYGNLANILQEHNRIDEAMGLYRAALAIKPNYAEARNNLGNALLAQGKVEAAIMVYRETIALHPDHAEAHSNLGNALKEQGLLEEAIAEHRRALALNPLLSGAHSNLVFAMHYQEACGNGAIAEELRRWDAAHGVPLARSGKPHANERSPERRLRIGYLSHDLRMHSVAFFLLPLLESHDRAAFDITGYSTGTQTDAVTRRLRNCCDGWVSLSGISDEMAAEQIRKDRIDILVDLGGHTAGNRLLVVARKPAPLQVSYLGFPGCTGLSAIDYRLSDGWADPVSWSAEALGVQEVVRLPETAWCFSPLSGEPRIGELPALGSGRVTFGSLNNLAKVSGATLDLWAAVLGRVAGSRLILKSLALGEKDTAERYRRSFAERGIAPERLDFRPHAASPAEHLSTYAQIDVALDTFPYHGTTTTCEALWMGVPVITLAGERHASRVGVSLLTHVGLADLVAHGTEEYAELARGLAEDLARLAQIRGTLRERMRQSPLMGGPRLARCVEAAYRTMWRWWCQRGAEKRGV